MNNKPEESFSVNLGGAELSITGQEYENLPTATLELKIATAQSTEVNIGVERAKELVRKALRHQARPLDGYVEDTKRIAHEWAGLEYEE